MINFFLILLGGYCYGFGLGASTDPYHLFMDLDSALDPAVFVRDQTIRNKVFLPILSFFACCKDPDPYR